MAGTHRLAEASPRLDILDDTHRLLRDEGQVHKVPPVHACAAIGACNACVMIGGKLRVWVPVRVHTYALDQTVHTQFSHHERIAKFLVWRADKMANKL